MKNKICPKCGIERQFLENMGWRCLGCRKLWLKEWRKKNKYKLRVQRIARVTPEKRRAEYEKNKPRHLAYSKVYYARNKERYSEVRKNWYKKNYGKIRTIRRRRRDAEQGAIGVHTSRQWENLKSTLGFTCPGCGKKEPEIKLTEDHIRPLSKGGSDKISNIQPLCRSCNSKKHTKTILYNDDICQLKSDPVLYEIYSR